MANIIGDFRQFINIDIDEYAYNHFYLETNDMFHKPSPFVQLVRFKRTSCSNEKQIIQLWTLVQTKMLAEISQFKNITENELRSIGTQVEVMLPISMKTTLNNVRLGMYAIAYKTQKTQITHLYIFRPRSLSDHGYRE